MNRRQLLRKAAAGSLLAAGSSAVGKPVSQLGLQGCQLLPGAEFYKTDCGYPSVVQLDDESLVTAYYFGPKRPEWGAHTVPWHQRYHMGVARWDLSMWPVE